MSMQVQSSWPWKTRPCTETCHMTYRSLRSVHPFFLQSAPFYPTPKSYALQCFSLGKTPQKCPFPLGEFAPPCNTSSLYPPDSASKLHLNWFSHLYTAHSSTSIFFTATALLYPRGSRRRHNPRLSPTAISPASTGSDYASHSHYDVIHIMTSFTTEAGPWALATPSVTDVVT